MATEKEMEELRQIARVRASKVRAALSELLEASEDWEKEIELELAVLSDKERIAFVVMAGATCGMLGNCISAAAVAPR